MLKKILHDSTIAVIAPGFAVNPDKLKSGVKYLESKGYNVKLEESTASVWGYLAATDEQRAREINENFEDPDVSAIICARGGWGSLRILDKLDYKLISKNPKALIGYSDITTLQLAIWKKSRVPSISGPMAAVEMAIEMPQMTEKYFWQLIENPKSESTISLSEFNDIEYLQEGSCQGTLIGGCLSLIAHQLGTPYMPDLENSILFVEDIGEDVYKMDRYLAHLKQVGIFEKIKGLVIGTFIDCEDDSKPNFTIKEVFSQYISAINGPVIFNFPYGHNMEKVSMPIGAEGKLDTLSKTLMIKNPFKAS